MELHDHMYSLGLQLGRQVFDDADGFRGALDDFLDEGAASTGDINLLVDAVRLGAYRSMVTMLDSGADAQRAIQFARSTPGVGTALVGMKGLDHVEENGRVARVPPAAGETIRKLFR